VTGERTDPRGGFDLERLLAERGDQLIRAAIALAGGRQEGEDLLQAALERILRHPRQPGFCRPRPDSGGCPGRLADSS